MKRWHLVLLWFGSQFAWNLLTKTPTYPDGGIVYRCLFAISYMTTLFQLAATVIVMALIWKRGGQRKSLAERHRERMGLPLDKDVN
jgi:hypothetical protein